MMKLAIVLGWIGCDAGRAASGSGGSASTLPSDERAGSAMPAPLPPIATIDASVGSGASLDADPGTVIALPMLGPSPDREAACEAWTGQSEGYTSQTVKCTDLEVIDGAKARTKGNIRAEAFYAEGLDVHCGLAVRTDAGVWLPPIGSMFGCGSMRSKSSWWLRQISLRPRTVAGTPTIVWVVGSEQEYDKSWFDRCDDDCVSVTRGTDVIICRGGDKPACATIHRDGTVKLDKILAETTIRWP
jgi:hypothetical protein